MYKTCISVKKKIIFRFLKGLQDLLFTMYDKGKKNQKEIFLVAYREKVKFSKEILFISALKSFISFLINCFLNFLNKKDK